MAEELAKKLQLRRALTGDRWVPAWRGGQPGCPPLCARNQLGQQCPPLPRAKLSLVPPGPGTRSGLGWHWGGGCAGSTAWVGAATDPQPIYLGSITPGTIPNKDTAPLIPVPAPCTMGVALGPVLSLSRPVPPQKNPFSTLGWCHPAPCAPATAVSHLHPNLFFRPEAALDVPSPVPAMRRGWHRVGGGAGWEVRLAGLWVLVHPRSGGWHSPARPAYWGGGGLRRV
ncbi:uncharacterized protein LOC126041948 [Accipiter gentilis]|uniref:uncharacterized protein LOC126041948 n=1 Tax=Astur gentilis TaxID=8957 RepID=UPI0021103285|nr:uncharacterized protein LOC126041948 [Accipiter gentilis]